MPFGAKRVVSFDAFFDAEERCLVDEDDADIVSEAFGWGDDEEDEKEHNERENSNDGS